MSETEKLAVRGCSIIEKDSGQIVAVGCRGYDREELERLCLCVNSHDALLAACELTEKRLLTHGEWDDNCFYYAGHSASELEEPLRKLKAAIAAAGEK